MNRTFFYFVFLFVEEKDEEDEADEPELVVEEEEAVGGTATIGVLGFFAMSCSLKSVLLERLGNCLYFKVDNCCNLG